MGSRKEQSTADCQMVRGRRQECADGEAASVIQVLQPLEQAKIHTGFPWILEYVSAFSKIQMVFQYT